MEREAYTGFLQSIVHSNRSVVVKITNPWDYEADFSANISDGHRAEALIENEVSILSNLSHSTAARVVPTMHGAWRGVSTGRGSTAYIKWVIAFIDLGISWT